MRNPTPYLKMRVLGAIDMAEGNSHPGPHQGRQPDDLHRRGRPPAPVHLAHHLRPGISRYQKHGVTVMENKPRSDKGKVRKVVLEDVLEAIRKVRPKVHGKTPTRALLYRLCIEQGLLTRSQVAPNTFSRAGQAISNCSSPTRSATNKQRLAFAKAHANEMWQADTLYGPLVQNQRRAGANPAHRLPGRCLARLLSRPVLPGRKCGHPHRIPARRFLQTRRAARALRGQRLHLHLQGNHPNLRPRRLPARTTRRCGMARPREKSNAFFAPCATSSSPAIWT